MKRLFAIFAIWLCLFSGLRTLSVAQDNQLSSQEAQKWADDMAQALIDNFWGASFKERPDRYFFNKMSQQADL